MHPGWMSQYELDAPSVGAVGKKIKYAIMVHKDPSCVIFECVKKADFCMFLSLRFAEDKRSVKNVKNGIDVWADFGVK